MRRGGPDDVDCVSDVEGEVERRAENLESLVTIRGSLVMSEKRISRRTPAVRSPGRKKSLSVFDKRDDRLSRASASYLSGTKAGVPNIFC
jgi:hypothetical protein